MSEIDRFLDQEKNQSSIKPERRSAGFTPAQRSNVVEQEQPQHRTSIDQFLEGAPAQDKGVSGVAKDLSLSIGQGLARLPGTAIAAADSQLTGGRVSKAIDDAGLNFGEQIADRLADHHTEKYKQQQQEFAEAGEGKDFAGRTIDKAAYALQNPALITGTVAQSLPDMIAGGFAGGRLSRASKGKVSPEVGAALGEGYMMMGHQAEDVRSQTEDGLLTPEQRGYVAGTGALGALFGWGGNRLARRLGIADADTLIAQGVTPQEIAANIAQMPAKSVPKALVQGAITEGFLEELPQEVSETILENLALGKDWSEGLDDAVVMAPLAGMVMGGPVSGYGAYRSNRDRAAAQQEGGQEQAQAIEPTPDQPPQAPEGVIEEQAYQASPPPQVQEQYRREGLGFTKPSERMGINPDDGPLSTAAAMAVDNALPHMPPPPIEGEYLAGETPTPMPMDRQVAFDRSSQYTVDAYGNVVDIDGNPVPYQPGDMPQLEAMEPRQETPPKPEMWEVDESGEARRAVNQEEYERQQRERYRTERVDLSSLDRGTEPRQQTRQEIDPIADAKNAWESMNSFQRNRIAQDAMGKRGVVAKNTATKKWQDLSEEEQQAVIRETEEQRNRGSWIDPNTASRAEDKPVLQNRDRSSRASIEQMNSIAGNPDYNRLSFSRDFGNGAPVVEQGASLSPEQIGVADMAATSQGRQIPVQYAAIEADQLLASNSADGSPNSQYAEGVEGLSRAIAGNGRVAGLQSAWDRGTAQQYKEAMINDQTHGIDPQVIERMDKPVLVRIMPSDQVTENIGDESNISGQSELSSVEQAKTDTRRLDLSLLEFSDDGDITAESAASFINSMPVSERAALLDGDRPSRRAIERLEAAVFQQAYGNDELTRLQAEAVRGEARNIVSGLMQAAPSMARLEGAGIYDIRPLVAEAAEVAINARRSGQPLKQYIEQQDFGRNPEILPILEMMADDYRSSQRMGDKLKALAQLSYSEGNKSSSDMFGEVPKADPQQIMEAAFTGEELRLDGQENAEGMGQQSRPELDAQDTTRPDVDGRGQEVLGEQSAEPEGWRGNYIQAARVAREIGIDPRQHKELADLVAAIDAHRAEQQATEEPLLDTYSEQELTEREEARQQAEREQEEQARQEEEAIRQQEEREYIRSQSEQAAENFELGQTAEENITGQSNMFSEQPSSSEQPRTSEYGSKNKLVSQERAEQLRKRLRAKLTQINSGFDPEILAIGAELAAFHIEAGVRKFSDFAQRIAEDLGTTPQNLRRYLRSWYNGARDMLEDNDINIDGMDGPEVVREELAKILDNQTEAVENAERTAGNTEPDSTFNEGTEAQENLQDEERGEVGQGVVETGQAASEAEQEASPSMGDGSTSSTREPSNKPVRSEKSRLEDDAARDTDDTGSLPDSTGGLFAEREGSEDAGRIAESAPSTIPKVNTPRNAKADKASIAQVKEQMPFLTDGQAQDVVFAEKRLRKPDGYGVLFTNGTGTGKTFSGLGIMKRMTMRGKGNILVVTPKQTINAAWIDAAHDFFDLKITALENTNDAGKGIVVTTYANLAENDAIMSRDWDAIVADEAHYLSSSQSGKETKSLQKFRALTLKRGTARARVYAKNRSLVDRMNELDSEASTWEKSDNETLWAKAKDLRKESSKIHEQLLELEAKEQERISSTKKEDMPRAVFLSATPFAYEKNVSWANEFLFDWGSDQDGLGYNSGDNYERFMMQHFGYRMRYNKLTEPESEVDRGLMQRSFNSWLKKEGVLSGRALDSQFDYDRIFIQTDNALGTRVDEAIDWLRENNKIAGMPELYERMIKQNFKYHDRMYFLEAIKAREALPIIQQHLDQGRKVVVMHDFKKGGTRNPFRINPPPGEVADAYGLFEDNFSDLIRDFSSLPSPIELLSEEFPDALVYNGDISAKRRVQLQNQFNSDSPDSPRVMIAQGDAMREGVSIHDTTGNYPRVMIHLGMPVKPTAAIQQEGRIYRTGQASNTMFRYLTIGTNWERFAFASRIASRASAAENLALGEQARGLKESFINAYENAGDYPAGFEGEGTGGKSIDQSYTEQLTPWDMAKSVYFGTKRQGRGRSARGREQSEFFATPEPLGMKMVQWADIQGGESTLEPSAGHGAIARWMPENTKNRAIELTNELSSRLALHFDGDLQTGDFMEHHVVNKYDAIVMNPPFGRGGAQAAEHVGKAMKHLNNGGRIVALIPNGPAADKRFDTLLQSDEAKGFYLVANIQLPLSTFERAGTAVSSRVIVLEKQTDEAIAANLEQTNLDFSNAENINELFDMLEDSEISPRSISQQEATQEVQQEAKVEGKAETWEAKHTKTGKTLYMAKPTESLEREDYLRVRDAAKEHGGYWSRFGKAGFLFSDEESRNNFINDAFNDSDPEIRRSESVGYIPGQTLRNADSFVSAVEAQFPNLGEATRKLLQLGEQGRKGGVVFVEGKSPKAIAKIYSEKTGIPLAQAEALLSDADTANGFYDVRSGITFLIGGNLNENNAAAVLLHEMLHSDQRANVDRMALDLLANRDNIRSKSLRDFIDRVEYQLAQAGESFNPLEAASYIVEQAVIEGRSQGYTMADNKFLNFIEKTVGKPVADLIRELVKSARQWMLRVGVGIQEITIDDLVQYSITALETNAKQIGNREIQVFNNTESIQRSQSQQDQTNTPEFKRWFGNSKVVDAEGNPLVVYHGTNADFSVFNEGVAYFTPRQEYGYVQRNSVVMPVYLQIKNPYYPKVQREIEQIRSNPERVEELKRQGYDGMIWAKPDDLMRGRSGWGNDYPQMVVFSPTQIKSAIGNNGSFDPSNPDIRFSRAPAVDTPAFKRWFGDSKVVDNNGKPIIVHHGTGSVFNTFDKDSLGSFTGADSAKGGFFFTSSRDLAHSFQSEAQRQSVDYDEVRERLNELTDKQLAELGDDIDQYNHSFEYDYNNNRGDFINSMVELLRDDMEAWVDDRSGIERHFQKHIGSKPFESGRVVDAYLKIENPLEHNFSENEDAFDEGAITRLIEQAKKQGKDGLILRNMLDAAALDDKGDGYIRSDVYVAFEPEQIKSATDNIGAFNENNPDIRYSRTAASAAEHVMNVADTLADKVDKWTNKDRVTPKHWTDGQKAAAAKFDTFMPRQPVSARLREIKEVSSKRFMQLVFDQFRPLQDLSKKAFMQAHLSRGSEGSVEAIATRGVPYLKDGAIAVRSDENGFMGSLAKLGDMEEVRKFLMWVAANRAENLMEEGRENLFTDEDIEAMKGFANGTLKDGRIRRVEYANTLRELNKYNKAVLDIAQEAGLINGDARKTWESEFYVPFYRVMQNENGTVSNQYTYNDDGLLRKEVIKRLKGGKENLGDPLENILYNWNSLISASMKNMAANEALIQGVELGISEPTDITKGNNIWTLQDGKRVYWEVHDKHVLEALESLNFNGYNNGLMKAAGKFKRMLTTGVTYSPTFRIRSLIRDTLHGMAVSDLSYNPVANMVNGWQKASKDSEVLAQMMAGGGAIRFGSMEEGQSADYMRRMIREGKITEEQILNTPEKFRNAINDFLKRYQELGDRMESVNRAEVYTRVLERTGSHLEASFAARDVMNYTSMGSAAIIRAMAQVLPFFNARMQGLNKLVRGANEDPRRFWGVVGTIGMASAALYLMQAGDDEYDALPDYVRDTYWPIKLGDKWVYIPKPFEVGVLGTVIERATELAVAGDDYQTKDFARTLGSLLINNLSLNPVPQIILPAAEAWYNYDMFRDAPIDSMAMQRLLPEDRYTANTSAGAVFLGQTLGASPQKIEHLVVGYLGWLGIQVLNVSDMLGRTMMDLPSSTKWDMSQSQNWFIVGDFLKEEGSTPSKYSNRFYEVQREINQIYSTANAARGVGDMDRYRELMDDPKMQARTQVSSANNRINLINRQIRNITADKQMSAAEKTQRLRELYNRREAIAKSVDAKSRAS